MSFLLAPSVLSADFGQLREQLHLINSSEADFLHIDIMDGVFVPNISYGFPIVDVIAAECSKPLDIHLMISQPEKYIEQFASYNPAYISIHYESVVHLHRTLGFIRSFGVKPAVALNPHSAASLLTEVIHECEMILLMSVNPGFGGQKFIRNTLHKITGLKNMIHASGKECLIEVDGGIDLTNAADILASGADILVAGNAVFKSPLGPLAAIQAFKKIGT